VATSLAPKDVHPRHVALDQKVVEVDDDIVGEQFPSWVRLAVVE
jgi:hypothetical protein